MSTNVTAMQSELQRLLAEKHTVESDLRNSGDEKYRRRLDGLKQEILTIETALGDARV